MTVFVSLLAMLFLPNVISTFVIKLPAGFLSGREEEEGPRPPSCLIYDYNSLANYVTLLLVAFALLLGLHLGRVYRKAEAISATNEASFVRAVL